MDAELTSSQLEKLGSILFETEEYIYAVVDSAMSNEIHIMVQAEALDYRCLYEAEEADLLEEVAPYLVQIEKDDYLANWLFKTVYKRNAISFIKSPADIESLATHLRQYAKIRTAVIDDNGKLTKQWVFFAFYDPRVFPRFINGNNPEQSAEFFEGIDNFICENADENNILVSYIFSKKNKKTEIETFDLNAALILEQTQEDKING